MTPIEIRLNSLEKNLDDLDVKLSGIFKNLIKEEFKKNIEEIYGHFVPAFNEYFKQYELSETHQNFLRSQADRLEKILIEEKKEGQKLASKLIASQNKIARSNEKILEAIKIFNTLKGMASVPKTVTQFIEDWEDDAVVTKKKSRSKHEN